MFGPIIVLEENEYLSKASGAVQFYYSKPIPFARVCSKLFASVQVYSVDATTNISVSIEHSLDGVNWDASEDLFALASCSTGYNVYNNSSDFGAFTRIALGVQDNGTSTVKQARVEIRVFGKVVST